MNTSQNSFTIGGGNTVAQSPSVNLDVRDNKKHEKILSTIDRLSGAIVELEETINEIGSVPSTARDTVGQPHQGLCLNEFLNSTPDAIADLTERIAICNNSLREMLF